MTMPRLRQTDCRHIAPSGDVVEDFEIEQEFVKGGAAWVRLISEGILAIASSTISVPLPPFGLDRRMDTRSVPCFVGPSRGRPISLVEARRIALGALMEAEERRAAYAHREAELITIWEDAE